MAARKRQAREGVAYQRQRKHGAVPYGGNLRAGSNLCLHPRAARSSGKNVHKRGSNGISGGGLAAAAAMAYQRRQQAWQKA